MPSDYCKEHCDIGSDAICEMCANAPSPYSRCKLGNKKGGKHRKCFVCKEEQWCREKYPGRFNDSESTGKDERT